MERASSLNNVVPFVPPTVKKFGEPRLQISSQAIRRDAWRDAEARVRYYDAKRNMTDAIRSMQRRGMPEGDLYQPFDGHSRDQLIADWRAAKAKLFLTPAYNRAGVVWKQKEFASSTFCYLDLTKGCAQNVISEDDDYLIARQKKRRKRPIDLPALR